MWGLPALATSDVHLRPGEGRSHPRVLGTEALAAAASAAGGMPPKIQVQFPKPRAIAFPAAGLVGREAKQCTDIATIAMERDETTKNASEVAGKHSRHGVRCRCLQNTRNRSPFHPRPLTAPSQVSAGSGCGWGASVKAKGSRRWGASVKARDSKQSREGAGQDREGCDREGLKGAGDGR